MRLARSIGLLLLCAPPAWGDEAATRAIASLASRVCSAFASASSLERLRKSLPPPLHDEETPPDWTRRAYFDIAPAVHKLLFLRDEKLRLIRVELTFAKGTGPSAEDFVRLGWTHEEGQMPAIVVDEEPPRFHSRHLINVLSRSRWKPALHLQAELHAPGLEVCEITAEGTVAPVGRYTPGSGRLETMTIERR